VATTSTTTTELAAQLRPAVTRIARRLRQEAGGLTPTLGAALATIERHGPITPSELADRERVKRPTATKLVGRLECEGLVARTPDPADGRSSLIAITAEGRGLLRDVRQRKDAYLQRRLRTLSPAERATLAEATELLERLLAEEGKA
jgi:DNA-binding MarR family transcriptional regulator